MHLQRKKPKLNEHADNQTTATTPHTLHPPFHQPLHSRLLSAISLFSFINGLIREAGKVISATSMSVANSSIDHLANLTRFSIALCSEWLAIVAILVIKFATTIMRRAVDIYIALTSAAAGKDRSGVRPGSWRGRGVNCYWCN